MIVSRLCFGSLGLGPLQANLPVAEGAKVIRIALELGVNFIDTAEIYQTYPYIRAALKGYPQQVHVASKSYAYTANAMEQSLFQALNELGVEQISLFLLHEQESVHTLRGHHAALERLVRAKEEGLVGAIGLSTHYIAGVRAAAATAEIDVIHPLLNQAGLGIMDGTAAEMLEAINFARQMGKGIYGMKALAGGHLHKQSGAALEWAWHLPQLDSVAVGMKTVEEVQANVAILEAVSQGRAVTADPMVAQLLTQIEATPKRLLIEEWCEGCGACVRRCPNKALQLTAGKAEVNRMSCVLCGYCGAVCPVFALKII